MYAAVTVPLKYRKGVNKALWIQILIVYQCIALWTTQHGPIRAAGQSGPQGGI